MGPRAGIDRCGKFSPTGILSQDHPARSESPYRLSYRGPHIVLLGVLNIRSCLPCGCLVTSLHVYRLYKDESFEEQRMCGDAVRIPSFPVRTVKNHEDIRLA